MRLSARLSRHLGAFFRGTIRVKSCNGSRAVVVVDALPRGIKLCKIPGIKKVASQEQEGRGIRLSLHLDVKNIGFPRGAVH